MLANITQLLRQAYFSLQAPAIFGMPSEPVQPSALRRNLRTIMLDSIQRTWRNIRNTTHRWVTGFIQNTHDHYFCYLPARSKSLSQTLFRLFYSGIRMDADQSFKLETLPSDAILIHATKFKSYFDFQFCHTRFLQDGFQSPEIGLGYHPTLGQPISRFLKILVAKLDHLFRHRQLPNPYRSGYIERELLAGRSAYFSLVEAKGFYRRFVKSAIDPVEYLIEMQRATDRPIYIVPHLMFFGKKALRARMSPWDILFGTELRPRPLRRLVTLFKYPGRIFMEISEPVCLSDFITAPENRQRSTIHLSLVLRRRLLVQLNRHQQTITGPILKSREEIKESILTSDRLRGTMSQFSQKRDIPLYKVHKEANQYLDEIAANYNNTVIDIGAKIVKWFIGTMFDGLSVNSDMFTRIKSMSRRGPLILVPCHKSHIDYLVLSYLMYVNNMPCPHVVAGKNLFFWPVGAFLRAAGAFSIRRSFKGAVLYSKVFAEYVHKLLAEGFNIELFIEGGRSRTGKLLPPQLGFLSILMQAFKNQACDDMIFVPIYVGYDRVPEEKAYLHEIEGGSKEPENLKQVLRARRALSKKYGRIYVKFAEPISFREMLDRRDLSISDLQQKEINALCRQMGNRIINAIGDAAVVTPHALTAAAALSFPKNRFGREQVRERVDFFMTHLNAIGTSLSDTLLLDHAQAIDQAITIYALRKFIEPIAQHESDINAPPLYGVNENRRPNLEYYKNSCAGALAPAAYTSLVILTREAFQFSVQDLHEGYDFIQNLFGLEFPVNYETGAMHQVARTIDAFVEDAILMPHPSLPETYNLTSAGFRKLELFSLLFKSYFESYLVVLYYFLETPKNGFSPKDRLKKIQAKGLKMAKSREIELKESFSKISFQNAVDFFSANGIRGKEDAETIAPFLDAIKKFLSVMPS
jgi:glycerol-3-phosphate O-acyltransferase